MLGLGLLLGQYALKGISALAGHASEAKRARQNAASALQAYGLNVADLGARDLQAQEAASQDRFLLGQEGAGAAGTATASAAEAGVSGMSVTSLLEQYAAETSFAQGSVDKSLANTRAELARRKVASGIEYQNRLAGVPKPSGFATGLEIGGASIDLLSGLKTEGYL